MTLDRGHANELLRSMVRVRRMEERAMELYHAEKIRGFLHLYIGEEAVAAGVMPALAPEDAVVATYREHAHALLRGVSASAIMSEMYGKSKGCSGGRGGSMHLFCTGVRVYGGSAIVGGGLPVAVGLALAARMQRTGAVTAAFFGEGAMAEGAFHESANLATLWKLPLVFFCENNFYAMGTALPLELGRTDLPAKAESYGMPAETVDGMDVLAVEEAARRAVDHVRGGNGPYFVEFQTYRFRAHSMFDAELYRSKAEVQEWRKRDPIAAFEARLRNENLLTDEELRAIEEEAVREVEAAVAEAEAAPWEGVETLTRHVYAESP